MSDAFLLGEWLPGCVQKVYYTRKRGMEGGMAPGGGAAPPCGKCKQTRAAASQSASRSRNLATIASASAGLLSGTMCPAPRTVAYTSPR